MKREAPLEQATGPLRILSFELAFETKGFCDVVDLTRDAARKIEECGVSAGQATFFVTGSTAGITTVEYEPGLVQDLHEFFERLIPQKARYHHEDTWHDGNGFSHIRASLLKPSLTVPLAGGKLLLGTWQQVILVDFDNRPRQRNIILQVIGV